MTRWIVAIGWCCLCQLNAGAQSEPAASDTNSVRQAQSNAIAALTLQVDRSSARVAEPIQINVRVKADSGVTVQAPDFSQVLQRWSIVEQSSVADLPTTEPNRRLWEWKIAIESYEPGPAAIPALTFALTTGDVLGVANSRESQLVTEPIEITIVSVLQPSDQPTEPRGMKGLAEIPSEQTSNNATLWIFALLGLAITSGIVGVFLSRRPLVDPVKLAEQRVSAIESSYRDQSLTAAESFAQLTAAVRELIQSQWAIPATSATSEELVDWMNQRLGNNASVSDSVELLKQFLETADQARFAATAESIVEPDGLFESARKLIHTFGDPTSNAYPHEVA